MAVAIKSRHIGAKAPSEGKPLTPQEDVRRRIAEKAYALYERRGHHDGYDLQDWLDAEYLVNEEIYEAH